MAKHYGFTYEELDFIINYDTCRQAGQIPHETEELGGRVTQEKLKNLLNELRALPAEVEGK